MPRNDYDDRYDGRQTTRPRRDGRSAYDSSEGRNQRDWDDDDRSQSRAGYRQSWQPRDEYGQFTGGRSSYGEDEYDRSRTSRGRNAYNESYEYDDRDRNDRDGRYSEDYESDNRRSWQPSQMQDRDEEGRFTGDYRNMRRAARYEEEYDDQDYRRTPYRSYSEGDEDDTRSGRAGNLSYQDRVRGGQHSARSQERDEYGHFTGHRINRGGMNNGYSNDYENDYRNSRGGNSRQRNSEGRFVSGGSRSGSRSR